MITIERLSGCAERVLIARLVPRCTPATLRARLFYPDGHALGHEVVDLLTGPTTGVGYLALDEHRPIGLANMVPDETAGTVEVALLVADRWQRKGVGRRLINEALADPRWAGYSVRATVAPGNRRILRLLRSLDLPMRMLDMAPGEYYYELRGDRTRAGDRAVIGAASAAG
ncbi:MAG TPA: GNAT family N-acetyltransferase [Pseudonocardia sp.]|nr:GNAT family N-acetyltransferase [Pseudonocardia sp.]